jgi:3-oxoadipate enol-lactonase
MLFEGDDFHGQILPLIGTAYRVEGNGPRWVTLITGIANDLTMWDGQMAVLEPHFNVLRYDLRGHGGTRASAGDYTTDLLLRDLVELLDAHRIERTSLVGLGLGGALAQAFAIRHPDRVARLMPCCCRAQMVPDFAAMWHKLRDTVRHNGLESIVEPTVQRWFSEDFKAAHPEVLDPVRSMIRRTTLEGYLGVTAAFLGLAEEERLHQIKAPTLYVSGADDQLGGPPALMASLASKVPGAPHVSEHNAAQIANVQNPEGCNRVREVFRIGE